MEIIATGYCGGMMLAYMYTYRVSCSSVSRKNECISGRKMRV